MTTATYGDMSPSRIVGRVRAASAGSCRLYVELRNGQVATVDGTTPLNLPVSKLPPLFAGMYCPDIVTNEDVTQLIIYIYSVERSPARGPAPESVEQVQESQTGYSTEATAIAGLLVVRTKHGMIGDPRFNEDDLSKDTGLTVSDVRDGLYELSSFIDSSRAQLLVRPELFTEFDRF